MYIPRAIEPAVLAIAKSFPVLLVTGPRQVGKTTLLKHIAEAERNYVTLDDPLQRRLALEEPELFLERFEAPVIIDEIQYAPSLLPHFQIRVDRDGTKGAYWLTGSQMFHLMRDASESLAGRVGIVHLLGLSQAEIARRTSVPFLPTKEVLTQNGRRLIEVASRRYSPQSTEGASPPCSPTITVQRWSSITLPTCRPTYNAISRTCRRSGMSWPSSAF